jgi:hypothetical protein
MGDPDSPPIAPVPRETVLRWMGSDNLEVLGAVSYFIGDKRYYPRIQPPLTLDDYHRFTMRYYERFFFEDPNGEWADSRYTVGRDLVNWFAGLWRDREVPRKILGELKEWLARLYKEGDDTLRICLVNATLEHLFENRDIAKYFADWQKDAVLEQAYRDAMLWSEKGGTSPLGK